MGGAVEVITVLRQQYRPTARTAPFQADLFAPGFKTAVTMPRIVAEKISSHKATLHQAIWLKLFGS